MLRVVIGLTLALAAFTTSAPSAMEFSDLTSKLSNADPNVGFVAAQGPIVAGDAERLREMFLRMKRGSYLLLLNSPGGDVAAALKVVHTMDNFTVSAVVPDGATCASACAQIIYISAPIHYIAPRGRLGLHTCSSAATGNRNKLCNEVIERNAVAHGNAAHILSPEMSQIGHDDMLWYNAENAECYGLVKRSPNMPSAPCITKLKTAMARTKLPDCLRASDLSKSINRPEDEEPSFVAACIGLLSAGSADQKLQILTWFAVRVPSVFEVEQLAERGTRMAKERKSDWRTHVIKGAVALYRSKRPATAFEDFSRAAQTLRENKQSVPAWLADLRTSTCLATPGCKPAD